MRNFPAIILVLVMFLSTACTGKLPPEEETAAIDAAGEWLALVDAGRYADSWNAAADFLKDKVPEEKWLETMNEARKPVGPLISRKVKSTQFRSMMPEVLKGKYLIIDYESSFKNRKSAVESITQIMGKDGQWRVGGYHLDQPGGM